MDCTLCSVTERTSSYQNAFTDRRCTESGAIAGDHLGVVSLAIHQTHVAECVLLLVSVQLQPVNTTRVSEMKLTITAVSVVQHIAMMELLLLISQLHIHSLKLTNICTTKRSTTVILPRSFYHGHSTVVILPWSFYHGHSTVVILPWSFYRGHSTTVILPRSFYHGHSTVVILPRSFYRGHSTTVILP